MTASRQDGPLCAGYVAVVDLHVALGLPPLGGKVIEHRVGPWRVRWNGGKEEQEGIPPFHMVVYYNGFPAGVMNPGIGLLAAGAAANEDTFIAAFTEAARAAEARS